MSEPSTFKGYFPETIQFFADIKENNNKPWFEAHKKDYQKYVVEPTKAFILAMGQRLEGLSPAIQYDTRTNGSGSMMRIYRDVRFSKDKSPYKTWLGVIFWEGTGKKTDCPGFYFGLGADGAGVHAGLHGFPKPFLAAYREAVVDDILGEELKTILATMPSAYTISDKHYKRVPRGYDKEHPRADLLLYKSLVASAPGFSPNVVTSPDLLDACFENYRQMAPLEQWLAKVNQRPSL